MVGKSEAESYYPGCQGSRPQHSSEYPGVSKYVRLCHIILGVRDLGSQHSSEYSVVETGHGSCRPFITWRLAQVLCRNFCLRIV